MKIALCQINPTIGDFDGNCARIESAAREAKSRGAELGLFSEMCVMGYPARDLLEKPAFLDAHDRAIERLRESLANVLPVIVGGVKRRNSHVGKPLHNSCIFLAGGKVIAIGDKCLLPTYDVFDEDRYFTEADAPTLVEFSGRKIGLTICEDCWNDKDFWIDRIYRTDPIDTLVAHGAEIIVNLSASPYHIGKHEIKTRMLGALAKKHRRPLLYANQVGGNDDLIFDGRSLAFDAEGRLLATGPGFEEGVVIVDAFAKAPYVTTIGEELERTGITLSPDADLIDVMNADMELSEREGPVIEPVDTELEEVHRALVLGTRDYARKCGFKTAVLGLSGGIDSALVAAIAAEAFGPANVTGVAMPSRYNAEQSLIDARESAARLGINFHVIPIEAIVGAFNTELAPVFAGRKPDVAEENIQARIRGVLMMALSNKFGHLLLTTGNKSELATGYCTLYGDMCGGLAVISDLYKTMVYSLSRHLNAIKPANPPIPISSIEKAPTAELRANQKDQDSLPPYDLLDTILKRVIEKRESAEDLIAKGYDASTVKRVLRLIDISEYKRRQAAPGLKVTTKAFGTGRRIPIAQKIP